MQIEKSMETILGFKFSYSEINNVVHMWIKKITNVI